jgi:hypothetical protein
MQITGIPKIKLTSETKGFISLYAALGERSENFIPDWVFLSLKNFVHLCHEEPVDPARQHLNINKAMLELKEAIPGYVDVALMIYPHENSKAFEYSARNKAFKERLNLLIDTEMVDEEQKKHFNGILRMQDFSIGTPPVSQYLVNYLNQILLGDSVNELRKFRDLISINGYIEIAQWNYLLDVMDQMVIQSTHYTTKVEVDNFLNRCDSGINFKGLNGFIRTLVSGTAETAIDLLAGHVFNPEVVKVIEFTTPDEVYHAISSDATSIFAVKIKNMRPNPFDEFKWFPLLSRIVFIDDSPESRATNTCLVFAFHIDIISTLNKAHTKKLGAPANTQMNLRLVLDKVNPVNLVLFRQAAERKILDYEEELRQLKTEQLADSNNPDQDVILYKFDEFTRQIIRDKYSLSKLVGYITLIEYIRDPQKLRQINEQLIREFETRMKQYFYGDNPQLHIATILEGGGRAQIKLYGDFLLQRKIKAIKKETALRCKIILDILPHTYDRTLNNHFHKNFGINLFLEKYKEYLTKVENEANNRGRFRNFLIDLGIVTKYDKLSNEEQEIVREFIGALGNLDKTSVSDDVQMIIRDLLFSHYPLRPFVFLNRTASWEYSDLLPADRFDINPFDIELELDETGRIDYERFLNKLQRIKNSFQLFDETGNLWDRFCANSTIIINDPSNPSGYSDFNDIALLKLLKFLSHSQLTLFLDEAYNDSVKVDDPEEPKWCTISRYIMNNISAMGKISMVSSVSTTKNLGATGNRLGSLISTPGRKDVIEFAKSLNTPVKGNTNSLFILVNVLEMAQLSKKVKDMMEKNLAKDASRARIKEQLHTFIKEEIAKNMHVSLANADDEVKRASLFEGSPLHIFLLDELVSLDKLDVLELPDDFKYKGEAFFSYYKNHIVRELNRFRVNRIFRAESLSRLTMAKQVAYRVLEEENAGEWCHVLESDGSYLFNLVLTDFFSHHDLEKFTKRMAETRGIALIPYRSGFIRFSLGDFLDGTDAGYHALNTELECGIRLFIKYWKKFYAIKSNPANKNLRTDDILDDIFTEKTDELFVLKIVEDFSLVKGLVKKKSESLKISDIKNIYLSFPKICGLSISSIGNSENAVFEFYENIGQCRNLLEFINSKAFSKVYENLLPQIYRKIPAIRKYDINEVIARFGKPTLLKYVKSKLEFQPNSHVLDDPEELLIMKEILLELESILFSDAKVKLLALNASLTDPQGDLARLEGYNRIMRKYIEEILLHFNLPFAQQRQEPSVEEVFKAAVAKFEEITGKSSSEIDLRVRISNLVSATGNSDDFRNHPYANILTGLLAEVAFKEILAGDKPGENLLRLWLVYRFRFLSAQIAGSVEPVIDRLAGHNEADTKLYAEELFKDKIEQLFNEKFALRSQKLNKADLASLIRDITLFLTGMLNRTKGTNVYSYYNHYIIKFTLAGFLRQNSAINEMVQHGYTLYHDFEMKNKALEKFQGGKLAWINQLMSRCGVIAAEQPVQTHTRMNTDAKKREYAFHKIDRTESVQPLALNGGEVSPREFIKNMATQPSSNFFAQRLAKFVEHLDSDEYRCRIVKRGLVKELYIFQKSYLKYLADNFRLIAPESLSLEEVQNFVPDIILFYGAPEKVISYPQIGYFDIPGPEGNIKTFVTPLKKKVDYFGDIKKPRLTMLNEKVKEMGGVPVHGSLFAVEEDDGTIFVVQISGDSGVGKSEMLAAMMLKWLKKDLPGIRSIKLIAGDMLHLFPDNEGNLYGIGTEVGDFSRVTDFDPDYIRQYRSLFESSADSNVEDLNSRSTISGFCDISMPFKIDIWLTAWNYAREEAGITHYFNHENFMLYRESHGERMEKATSGDLPSFQRTFLRYTGDKNIVELLDRHGNYLDTVLDWEYDEETQNFYLCSSYKLMDKIDVEEVVNKVFVGKKVKEGDKKYRIEQVKFDVIKNRFRYEAVSLDSADERVERVLDRKLFHSLFNALASTPGGNPFIAEEGEEKSRRYLVELLKGGADGKGKGRRIQTGILSTDLGKKGKEIAGPQKAAEDLKRFIREVRVHRPEINRNKQLVKELIIEKYGPLFKHHKHSLEVWRYNYYLFQLEQMRKARFVRIDDPKSEVKVSLKGFEPLPASHEFSPLLVTPNINVEINGYSETYEQLMQIPHTLDFAGELYDVCKDVYVASGYNEDTIINNIVVQMLMAYGYIDVEDLSRGKITEKANRETIAAARYAATRKYNEVLDAAVAAAASPKPSKGKQK